MALAARIPEWLEWLRQPKVVIQEIIGRTVLGNARFQQTGSRFKVRTVDQTIPNYEFWDKLRRGKQPGYKLGGLYAKRIERIFANWVLGAGLEVRLADTVTAPDERIRYTNEQLQIFVTALLDSGQDTENEENLDRDDNQASLLMQLFRDSLGLGDQYPIVNADGSLSIPSPDTVDVERDELDYRQIHAVTVTSKLQQFTVQDIYRANSRTVVVKQGDREIERQEFTNLIGRIPVVHVAHGMSANETNGHPIHEELLVLYDEYDDLIFKQLDGAKLFGIPILAITGLEDLSDALLDNKPLTYDEYIDKDGNIVDRQQFKLDQNSILLLGKGGDSKYITPTVGFTEDTKTALKSLFLLLLDHTGIAEFIWGNEVASGRSSSETQMREFERTIAGYQRDNGGWILKLCKIWLATQALMDPQLIVDRLALTWPPISEEDKELLLKFLEFAKLNDLLTDETALRLTNLVENPEQEILEADEEAEERRERMFPDGGTFGFGQQLTQAQTEAQQNGAGEEEETA